MAHSLKAKMLSWLASIRDRKSTRLNSSHGYISYAVFCLKKKKLHTRRRATLRSAPMSLACLLLDVHLARSCPTHFRLFSPLWTLGVGCLLVLLCSTSYAC